MAQVVFERISKTFVDDKKGKFNAVDDISFEIKDKEFVVFVGPSGCGKTTSLRMISGLEKQTSGNIFIGDKIVNALHPKERNIAMVFQDYALYPHMTVFENLSFGLKNLKTKKSAIEKKVKEAVKILGIEELLDRKPRELSGGQRQRVAIGRAIVRNPEVFLFDEPLSNLDAKLRVQMRVELAELHKKLGTTIVYVTHDQVEAMTLGERIVVMNQGRVQQFATPDELYNAPANLFVASFIGAPSMNFIEGQVGGDHIKVNGDPFTIPKNYRGSANDLYNGRKVTIGIRPEDILDPQFSSHLTNSIQIHADIKVVERLGNENLLYFDKYGSHFTARVDAGSKISAGENAHLNINLDKLYLFDMENGNAFKKGAGIS